MAIYAIPSLRLAHRSFSQTSPTVVVHGGEWWMMMIMMMVVVSVNIYDWNIIERILLCNENDEKN